MALATARGLRRSADRPERAGAARTGDRPAPIETGTGGERGSFPPRAFGSSRRCDFSQASPPFSYSRNRHRLRGGTLTAHHLHLCTESRITERSRCRLLFDNKFVC